MFGESNTSRGATERPVIFRPGASRAAPYLTRSKIQRWEGRESGSLNVSANSLTVFSPSTFLVRRTRREMPRDAVRSRSRSQYRLGWRPPRGPLTSSKGLSLFRSFSLRFDHIGSGAYRPNPEHRRANSKIIRNDNHIHGSN
jgi:hypothetical protein